MTQQVLTPAEFLKPDRVARYRHIDRNGELLYVGITTDPGRRWAQHLKTSFWARFVADTEVEWFEGRDAARKAERNMIAGDRPLFNAARPRPTPGLRRKPITEHQLAYLRTGVSGLFRRPRCAEHGYFHAACGPDRDAWLDASWQDYLDVKAYHGC